MVEPPRRNDAPVERLLALYATMLRIRAFEEAAEAAQLAGEVRGAVHLSIGQEAVAAGVCANLAPTDLITSNHRGHGHTIAKGADPAAMMAELHGKATGTCGGKGGSMHIADFSVGMLGANGVVGAGMPIAVGAAHGLKLTGRPGVVACFFGDGAINRGPFLEALNWARIYDLPVLFVCEDNGFAATTRTRLMSGGPGAAARAESLGVPTTAVDGNDVEAVDAASGRLVEIIRAGGGPQFLHALTYRLKGHTASDAAAYRPAAELEAKRADDPIARARTRLIALDLPKAALDGPEEAARTELERAVAAARAAPWPALDQAYTDVLDVGAGTWR
jgi:TPP-dependent pyruvate/acetoin dehydrogenase alpha subunit